MSTSDIIRLQEIQERRNQILGLRAQSSAGDSSVSSSGSGCATPGDRPTSPVATMSTIGSAHPPVRAVKKRRAPPPPGPPKVQPSKSTTCLVIDQGDIQDTFIRSGHNQLPSKSMSMSNLKSLDHRSLGRSNMSTISTDSNTSINSLGKKRRAPLPPPSSSSTLKLMNQVSIPEETPSMVHLENHVPNLVEQQPTVRRVLPEVPPPPPPERIEEPKIVPKSDPPPPPPPVIAAKPEPAPRSSIILDEVKIDTPIDITKKKKKSAKKNKKNEVIPEPTTSADQDQDGRALSPDSALASSESSAGSSLRKQGKQSSNLVRITPYQQFKPVVQKSARIQEKIALFSGQKINAGQASKNQENLTKTTTGRIFPIPRQPQTDPKSFTDKVCSSVVIFHEFFIEKCH